MLISLPFLADAVTDADDDLVRYAMGGSYPVTSHLEWHNGVHLISPTADAPVRAIADGKVIYVVQPDKEPSSDVTHAQNYGAADGKTKLWTDKGMLILEHETEIGANGTTPVTLKYYSVYMHLKTLEAEVSVGKQLYRKAKLGQPGQIYGQPNHMHFEVCMDEANITKLLGHAPGEHPAASQTPTADGRTDVVFGGTYVYLPANTPVLDAEPSTHMATASAQTLGTALWVQIDYAGAATLTSYHAAGDLLGTSVGQRSDPEAEYKLYSTATKRHDSLSATQKATSSPSGWYELLRFGRNLGRGPLATDKDPLPDRAEHWRKICTPAGEKWANLNALGTFKFSEADFPSFLGWQCISDDEATTDQRCDSPALRTLLAVSIEDMAEREKALQKTPSGRSMLAKQIKHAKVKDKLPRLICKFPSEFDQGTFEARYGHVKEEDEFKNNDKNWTHFQAHIQALTRTDLPKEYKEDAQWHVHPVTFIDHMRKCGWLSANEFAQCFPRKGLLGTISWSVAINRAATHSIHYNKFIRKYCNGEIKRYAQNLVQSLLETGAFRTMVEDGSGNGYIYGPFYGRGYHQITWLINYKKYGDFKALPHHTGQYSDSRINQTTMHAEDSGGVLKRWSPLYDPNQLGTNLSHAGESSGWYWVSKKYRGKNNINQVSDLGFNVDTVGFISWLINGGGNGYALRQQIGQYISNVLFNFPEKSGSETFSYPAIDNSLTGTFPLTTNIPRTQTGQVYYEKQVP